MNKNNEQTKELAFAPEKAVIKSHNGRPAIFIDGKPYPPMMATIRTNNYDSVCVDEAYLRALGKQGIRIFFVICDTLWLKPNAIDLFKQEAEAVLKAVPDAYLVPRIGLHPTNEWIKDNPDECVMYSDKKQYPCKLATESYCTTLPAQYSLSSKKWRIDAGKALAETWEILMNLPYADRIIGCFFAAGGTSEWYYLWGQAPQELMDSYDHSPAFLKQFSTFLTEKYKTDEALQKAWKNDKVTLASPIIPAPEGRYYCARADVDASLLRGGIGSNDDVPELKGNGTNVGVFTDVNQSFDHLDFFLAWHDGTARSVQYFASIIKGMTPDRLTGAFYGSLGCTGYHRSSTAAGTLRLLDDKKIDFLAAPSVYENRQPGGLEGQREVPDSFALRNKIYIVENDVRTHAENAFFKHRYGTFDETDSIDVMKREFGRNICEDTQGWWFDQLLGGRRYNYPALLELIGKQQRIAEQSYKLDRTKNSEIALIFDLESIPAVSQRTTHQLIEVLLDYDIAKVGAPVDRYFHNDMSRSDMPDYKLYVFLNCFVLSNEERSAIKRKLQKNHATALFIYASGLINPDKETPLSKENISQLTGFKMEMLDGNHSPKFRISDQPHPLTVDMQRRKVYGWFDRKRMQALGPAIDIDSSLWPVFCPTDGVCLGRYLTFDGTALAVKETDGFTSVFHGAKILKCDTLRSVARYAGCHIYCDTDETLFVNKNYITIHAADGGSKVLHFPKKCRLTEVYENKVYADGVTELVLPMYIGETKMFYIEYLE